MDVGTVYETTLYVAAEGGDDEAAGTADAPLASLGAAASRATPGTRIVLRAGVHRGRTTLEDLAGAPGRPIAIQGEPGAVLDAMGAGEVLHLTDPRYVVVEDLVLRNATQNGLNIDDGGSYETPAGPLVLRRLNVSGIGTGDNNDCVKLSGLDDFQIRDSDIRGCNAGSAIDMVGCHRGLIAGNRLYDLPGSTGIQAKGGTADVTIHGNRFTDIAGRGVNAGGSTGLDFFRPIDAPHEAARIRMYANVFVRVGAESGAPVAFVGCDACVFAHNTLVEPRTWIARILQETVGDRFVPSRRGEFVNNLIVFRRSDLRTFVNVGPDTDPGSFSFGWNLWYALDTPDFAGPVYGDGLPPEQDSTIQQDPGLDAEHRPGPGSPARGAGRALEPSPPGDFDQRCYDTPDVGAFVVP